MYKIDVQIRNKKTEHRVITVENKESLLDSFIRNACITQSICGGNGTCGKCKVQVCGTEKSDVPVTAKDKAFFSETELEEGWRLACALYPKEDMTILLDVVDDCEYEILSRYKDDVRQMLQGDNTVECALLIDLGTTTLVFQLIEKRTKRLIYTVTSLNSQHKYGADVISRIQAATQQKAGELRACIIKDLGAGIAKVAEETGICTEQIEKIVIAGNTTMIHLLMGYESSGLGRYPFTPVNMDMICEPMDVILRMENVTARDAANPLVTIFPGISAFVGGDILSGLYALEFDKKSEINLLIDLGTNGEIALGNKDRILVASTAAGPAFEGGNISWGMGSIAGAVSSVKINRRKMERIGARGYANAEHNYDVKIQTIYDKLPCGICGTGVIEIMAELLENKIADETGLLTDEYFDRGFPVAKTAEGEQIVLTQKDIRELQLAKAAIRAGVETLILRYGINADEISKVYLAGGFGYFLDVKKAAVIGMLPKELIAKTEAVGNTSLAGTARFLYDKEGNIAIESIRAVSEDVVLAKDSSFNELYMKFMYFE